MTAGPRGAVSRFIAADGFFMSAGLAFFFLVCLIPQLLLGVSLVGFVLSGEEAARHVVGQLARAVSGLSGADCSGHCSGSSRRATASGVLGTAAPRGLLDAGPQRAHDSSCTVSSGVRGDGGFLRNLVRDSWMALLLSLLLFTVSTMTWLYHGFRALALNSLPVPPRWFALAGRCRCSLAPLHRDVLLRLSGTCRAGR